MVPQSDLAESYGSPSKCDSLLWDTLQNRAINSPNSTALVSAHQQGTCLKDLTSRDLQQGALQDSATWTYARLMDSSLALADQLFDLGLRSGDVFVAFISNSVEWAALLWACARLQVTFAPLNPAFIERPDDLQHIMNTLRPKGVICADRSSVAAIDAAIETYQGQSLAARIYLQGEGHPEDDLICFSDLELQEDRGQTSKNVSPPLTGAKDRSNEPAMVLVTSGTTSLPKACPHTAANLHAQSDVFSGIRQVRPDRRFLILGPLFHIQSVWNVLMAWRAGAAVILPSPTFEAGAALKSLAYFECTHMSCGPSMVSALVAHPSISKDGYEHLQSMALGSDLISRDLVELCREKFRAQKVFAGWGMSESIGCIVLGAGKDVMWHEGTPTVGYVTPGNAVRVCKPGTRTPVKKGETGELHIGGNTTIGGYTNGSRGAVNDVFYLSDGINWLATGDLALMDDSEAIFIKGRIKDMIIRGGENISPAAMESCINAIGGVKVCHNSGVSCAPVAFADTNYSPK
jgi:acyl-CoA synthetase (AMP-forming)/AMP-acid ligase II